MATSVSDGASLRQDGPAFDPFDGWVTPPRALQLHPTGCSQRTSMCRWIFNWVRTGCAGASDHVDGAYLSVDIDGQNYRITRLGLPGSTGQFMAWSTTGALTKSTNADALSGKYRITRTGTTSWRCTLMWAMDAGTGQHTCARGTAQVVLGNGSINACPCKPSLPISIISILNSGPTTDSP